MTSWPSTSRIWTGPSGPRQADAIRVAFCGMVGSYHGPRRARGRRTLAAQYGYMGARRATRHGPRLSKKERRDFILWTIPVVASVLLTAGFGQMAVLPRLALVMVCITMLLHLAVMHLRWTAQVAIQIAALLVVSSILWFAYGQAAWNSEQSGKFEGTLISPPSQFGPNDGIALRFADTEGPADIAWGSHPPPGRAADLVRIANDTRLRLDRGPNGTVLLTTQVRDSRGNLIVDIDRNRWRVSPDTSVSWDHNYTSNALEVLDGRGHAVLSVSLFSNEVALQGLWSASQSKAVELFPCRSGAPFPNDGFTASKPAGKSYMVWVRLPTRHGQTLEGCEKAVKIPEGEVLLSRMFNYPSNEYWGQYAER